MDFYHIDGRTMYGQCYTKDEYQSFYDPSLRPGLEGEFSIEDIEGLEASFSGVEASHENFRNIGSLCDTYLGDLQATEGYSLCTESAYSPLLIEDWCGEDCYNWAEGVCRSRGLDYTEVNLHNFRLVRGDVLQQYSAEDFCTVAGDLYGTVFYQDFRSLQKRESKAMKRQNQRDVREEEIDSWSHRLSEEPTTMPQYSYSSPTSSSSSSSPPLSSSPGNSSSSSSSPSPSSSYLVSPAQSSSNYINDDLWELSQEEFHELDRYIPEHQRGRYEGIVDDLLQLIPSEDVKSEDSEENDDFLFCQDLMDSYEYRGPPESANNAVSEKVKTTSRKGERGPKIWEFLMRLLVDSNTNPELIRWDDMSKGTFVLTQPAVIAQLWGARAKKPSLSANNFARALRYHYKTGALTAISERHYMYRCGPKAIRYLAENHSILLPSTASSTFTSDKERQKSFRKKNSEASTSS